jgi:hypothetical protein
MRNYKYPKPLKQARGKQATAKHFISIVNSDLLLYTEQKGKRGRLYGK